MFVAGLIADLEFSLRSTAKATQKAEFGVTSAKRAKRAADRLRSAQEKLQQPILQEVLAIFEGVKLKINNQESLEQAANNINKLGIKFAATVPGKDLAAIEGYIPKPDRWK
jgi:predicted TIM-barrel fold metal-dependent hydrolase